jgi:hypothetical protein
VLAYAGRAHVRNKSTDSETSEKESGMDGAPRMGFVTTFVQICGKHVVGFTAAAVDYFNDPYKRGCLRWGWPSEILGFQGAEASHHGKPNGRKKTRKRFCNNIELSVAGEAILHDTGRRNLGKLAVELKVQKLGCDRKAREHIVFESFYINFYEFRHSIFLDEGIERGDRNCNFFTPMDS